MAHQNDFLNFTLRDLLILSPRFLELYFPFLIFLLIVSQRILASIPSLVIISSSFKFFFLFFNDRNFIINLYYWTFKYLFARSICLYVLIFIVFLNLLPRKVSFLKMLIILKKRDASYGDR